MFAVKHVLSGIIAMGPDYKGTPAARTETLYLGDVVTYTEGENIVFGPLEVRKGDCLVAALWGGTAYVMNETGKTIDVYHLRPAPAAPAV